MSGIVDRNPSLHKGVETPRVRLAFGRFLRIAATLILVVLVYLLWKRSRPIGRFRGPRRRMMVFLYLLPRTLVVGLLAAAVLAILCDLLVRFILSPLVARWLNPRVPHPREHPTLPFAFDASESLIWSAPGRVRSRAGWPAGNLILTERRLWFAPCWGDGHAIDLDRVTRLESIPTKPWLLGSIRGFPDRLLVVSSDANAGTDANGGAGRERMLVSLGDPAAAMAELAPRLRQIH